APSWTNANARETAIVEMRGLVREAKPRSSKSRTTFSSKRGAVITVLRRVTAIVARLKSATSRNLVLPHANAATQKIVSATATHESTIASLTDQRRVCSLGYSRKRATATIPSAV